jgi:hypothetical protein
MFWSIGIPSRCFLAPFGFRLLFRTPTLKSWTGSADALSYLAPRFAAEENPVQGSKNSCIRLAERPADKRLGIAPVKIKEFEDGQHIWCFTEW